MEVFPHLREGFLPSEGAPSAPAERLERGQIVYFPVCPFPLPEGEDRNFLLEQRLAGRAHKNISFNPKSRKVSGFRPLPPPQVERLRELLATFAEMATEWLAHTLPAYARGWELDLVSFRPEEEATRKLRLKSRNDLLHVDAFPTRPTNGRRILRLFANVNLTEPRVWQDLDATARVRKRAGAKKAARGK